MPDPTRIEALTERMDAINERLESAVGRAITCLDDLEAENKRLREALDRTLHNFEALLARKPVRDAAETIAEARRALSTTKEGG